MNVNGDEHEIYGNKKPNPPPTPAKEDTKEDAGEDDVDKLNLDQNVEGEVDQKKLDENAATSQDVMNQYE